MDELPSEHHLFQHAACGLVVAAVDGTIRAANATFCRWLGYDCGDLVGKLRVQQLFTVGGRVFHHTHWSPLLQLQGSIAEVQLDMIHKDGERLPMLINVVRRQHGSETFDELAIFIATDRKKYERELLLAQRKAEASLAELQSVQKQLQESRDVLGLAMRGAQMGVWSLSLVGERKWWLSHELRELVGIKEGAFSGTTEAFADLLHHEDRPRVLAAIDASIATGSDYLVEFRVQLEDGLWRQLEARGRISQDERANPVSLIGVVMDVTERKNAELQLRQLNEQLSIADRRKDEFLATLAHELRNPMAPVRNVLELLKLKELHDPHLIWTREVLDRQVQQMTHLIDDLMDVSRIAQGRVVLRKQAVDFNEIARNALDAASAMVEEARHTLTVDLPDQPLVVDADATRLTQITSNLLTNAIKYTPEGGRIHLRVVREGEWVELSVTDSGIGIAESELANVFRMFSQLTPALERAQGGLGIGLSLVRGLVELHGGTIHAESKGENQGSKFVVRLPLGAAENTPATTSRAEFAVSEAKCGVLIIDDNIDAAESLAMALDMFGYTTSTAHNGRDGLQAAESRQPDVILLDIGLPDISGYEIARRIREAVWGRGVALVAVTGWGQEEDKSAAKAAGFDRHLTKPLDFSELSGVLAELTAPM